MTQEELEMVDALANAVVNLTNGRVFMAKQFAYECKKIIMKIRLERSKKENGSSKQ